MLTLGQLVHFRLASSAKQCCHLLFVKVSFSFVGCNNLYSGEPLLSLLAASTCSGEPALIHSSPMKPRRKLSQIEDVCLLAACCSLFLQMISWHCCTSPSTQKTA